MVVVRNSSLFFVGMQAAANAAMQVASAAMHAANAANAANAALQAANAELVLENEALRKALKRANAGRAVCKKRNDEYRRRRQNDEYKRQLTDGFPCLCQVRRPAGPPPAPPELPGP